MSAFDPLAGEAGGVAEPATTIPALLDLRREQQSGVAFLVQDDDALTYGDLEARTHERARRLVATGVGPGTRVGLLAPNGIAWAVDALAVLRIGAVLVPLSTLLRPPELVAQLRIAGVAVLLASPEHRGRRPMAELDAELPGIASVGAPGSAPRHAALPNLRAVLPLGGDRADHAGVDAVPAALVDALEAGVGPGDDLAVLFTSGSRGAPKGTIHTHGGAIRATAAGLGVRGIGEGDRLYIPMPFFWTGGFSGGLLSALVAGATLLTETDPTPASTIALLERHRATLFRGWPDQAAKIAADPAFATADLSSLRDASLPAVLPADRRPAAGARANLFGMTETFGPYCGYALDTDMPPGEDGSCGQPFTGIEVRITAADSADGDGDGDGAASPGAIEVRGPNIMRGMCGRFRADVFTVDSWYGTGDLGVVDDAGFLFTQGRVDDMVKVSGATVYPSEVEAALRAVPGVEQAHVTDVPDDGEARTVGALIVLREPRPLEEVDRDVRARLSSFKVPRRWVVAPRTDVPLLASGKVDKAALQALIVERGTTITR
jgi:acyl-CoA synthetase (AMP-forming)/AMP-acid ligase II